MSSFGKVGEGLYIYQFPRFEKGDITRLERCEKIIEEAQEHKAEIELGNDFASLVELLDTFHSCESELRAGFEDGSYTDEMLKQAKLYVLSKNARRGYYGEQTIREIEFAKVLNRRV